MINLLSWLASLPIGQALRRLNWLVPWLQVVHILANGVILGAVVMIDMRVWGISRSQTTIAMARRFLPWVWGALAMLTVSGVLLIYYTPRRALFNPAFQVKMWTMVIAVGATVALLFALRPKGEAMAGDGGRHRLASLLAGLTLALWVGVTLAGRGGWFAAMMARMMQ